MILIQWPPIEAMRLASSLIASVALAQLAACGSHREDAEKISIAGQRFDIPLGCTGTAPQNISQNRVPKSSLLISIRLPDAECPPNSTVGLPGENDRAAIVLVTSYGPGIRQDLAQEAIFDSLTTKTSNLVPGSLHEMERSTTDRRFTFAVADNFSVDTKYAWKSLADPKSYLICTRSWQPPNASRIGRCEHHFTHRGLSFQLYYNIGWASQWHGIEAAIRNRFDSFARLAN